MAGGILSNASPYYVSPGAIRTGNRLNLPTMGVTAQANMAPGLSGGGGTDWLGILPKILAGVGGVAGLAGYGLSGTDFTPSLTAATARQLVQGAGRTAYGQINTRADLGKASVASQYAGRGLGSSGAVIGDIAGIESQAAQSDAMVQASLNAQLADLLKYIDQRDMQLAIQKASESRDFFSTLGDIASMSLFLL